MSAALSKSQQRYLRGLCHNLQPVVMIAEKGLSENVCHEINLALDSHELIKIKVRTERQERDELVNTIMTDFNVELVQKIGQVACFYRHNADAPKLALPA